MNGIIKLLAVIGVAFAILKSTSNKTKDVKYVVRYFDIKGRAEAIRLCLSDIGAEWEDDAFTGEEGRGGGEGSGGRREGRRRRGSMEEGGGARCVCVPRAYLCAADHLAKSGSM